MADYYFTDGTNKFYCKKSSAKQLTDIADNIDFIKFDYCNYGFQLAYYGSTYNNEIITGVINFSSINKKQARLLLNILNNAICSFKAADYVELVLNNIIAGKDLIYA